MVQWTDYLILRARALSRSAHARQGLTQRRSTKDIKLFALTDSGAGEGTRVPSNNSAQ